MDEAGNPGTLVADGPLKKSHEAVRRAERIPISSTGEQFAAIRTALADRSNLLTVKELCELVGVSRDSTTTTGWATKGPGKSARNRNGQCLNRSWRRIGSGVTPKASATSICSSYSWVCASEREEDPLSHVEIQTVLPHPETESLPQATEIHSDGHCDGESGELGVRVSRPRVVLLTDITYIPLRGGFCYRSTILDACTKRFLAYAMSEEWISSW